MDGWVGVWPGHEGIKSREGPGVQPLDRQLKQFIFEARERLYLQSKLCLQQLLPATKDPLAVEERFDIASALESLIKEVSGGF